MSNSSSPSLSCVTVTIGTLLTCCVCLSARCLPPVQQWHMLALNHINNTRVYSGLLTSLLMSGQFLLWFMTKWNSTFDSVAHCSFKICLYFPAYMTDSKYVPVLKGS
jgi:hypothetical protein